MCWSIYSAEVSPQIYFGVHPPLIYERIFLGITSEKSIILDLAKVYFNRHYCLYAELGGPRNKYGATGLSLMANHWAEKKPEKKSPKHLRSSSPSLKLNEAPDFNSHYVKKRVRDQ